MLQTPARVMETACLVLLAVGLAASCSTQTFDRTECSNDTVCQTAFGASSMCVSGYCTDSSGCTTDSECVPVFGETATCVANACVDNRMSCSDATGCTAAYGPTATCGVDGFCVDNRVPCTTADQCSSLGDAATCNEMGFCEAPEVECTEDLECLETIGFGANCEDGMCRALRPNPRCTQTFPEGLLNFPAEFKNAVVFGSIVERGFDGDAVLENAARLAIREANENGLADGRNFGVVLCDMSEDATIDVLSIDDAAIEVANWLVDELHVTAIHGPTTSGTTELVFEEVRDSDVLVISPSATSPDLILLDEPNPTDERPGLLWRTVPPDSLQGRIIAEDMRARGVSRVSVITEQGSYGVGLQNFFSESFEGMGGVVVEQLPFSDETQRNAAITTAGSSDSTEVLFISGEISDSIAFLNAASGSSNYDAKGLFLTDTSKTSDIFGDGSTANAATFSRVRLTAPSAGSGAVFDQFALSYSAEPFPEDPTQFGFLPQAYDAVWLLVYGSAWAEFQEDSITGTTIARGLRKLSSGTSVAIGGTSWLSIRAALRSGNSVDVQGASGELDFDPDTEETEAPIDVIVTPPVCGGGYTLVTVAIGADGPAACVPP